MLGDVRACQQEKRKIDVVFFKIPRILWVHAACKISHCSFFKSGHSQHMRMLRRTRQETSCVFMLVLPRSVGLKGHKGKCSRSHMKTELV